MQAGEAQRHEDADTARLVALAQAGDNDAFATVYTRYFDRIFNYLRVVLKDRDEAEDITQQVFTEVFESLGSYKVQPGRPFRAWLFAVVRNQALMSLRRAQRVEVMDPAELDRRREAVGDEDVDLGGLDWITDSDLVVFVRLLPLPQRQVLLLRFLLDMPGTEIAETLGRSHEDVRTLQHRAVRFLEERLTAIGRGPDGEERERKEASRDDQAPVRRCDPPANVLRARRYALFL